MSTERLTRYEVTLEADVEVRQRRLAEDEDQAEEFGRGALENAIRVGLAQELTGGESSIDVEVVDVREVDR